MSSLLHNYLSTYRKRAGLSQQDVARLASDSSSGAIARNELANRLPSLKLAIAYEVIYGERLAKLFAGLYEEVEADIADRAKELLEEIDAEGVGPRPRKYRRLSEIAYPDDPVIVPWTED